MTHEDSDGYERCFPGSLREAIAPMVSARPVSSPPIEAIVRGGRRRSRNQRLGMAAAGMAVVAATPLALPALAGHTGAARTVGTASDRATTGPKLTEEQKAAKIAAAMPKQETLLVGGTAGGHTWKITVKADKGTVAEFAEGQDCLRETYYIDGVARAMTGSTILYCVYAPGKSSFSCRYSAASQLPGGAPTLYISTVPANVAKVTAHIDGAGTIKADTVRVPGINAAFFAVGVSGPVTHSSFDMFDAKGAKVGSWDNQGGTRDKDPMPDLVEPS